MFRLKPHFSDQNVARQFSFLNHLREGPNLKPDVRFQWDLVWIWFYIFLFQQPSSWSLAVQPPFFSLLCAYQLNKGRTCFNILVYISFFFSKPHRRTWNQRLETTHSPFIILFHTKKYVSRELFPNTFYFHESFLFVQISHWNWLLACFCWIWEICKVFIVWVSRRKDFSTLFHVYCTVERHFYTPENIFLLFCKHFTAKIDHLSSERCSFYRTAPLSNNTIGIHA